MSRDASVDLLHDARRAGAPRALPDDRRNGVPRPRPPCAPRRCRVPPARGQRGRARTSPTGCRTRGSSAPRSPRERQAPRPPSVARLHSSCRAPSHDDNRCEIEDDRSGARDTLACRQMGVNREVTELDQQLDQRTPAPAQALLDLPGCGAITVVKLLAEITPSAASKAMPSSRGTAAAPPSRRAQAESDDTASTELATANSTRRSIGSPSPRPASTSPHALTSNANAPKARAAAKPSAASSDCSSASSSRR
jgi:hypothetical protein